VTKRSQQVPSRNYRVLRDKKIGDCVTVVIEIDSQKDVIMKSVRTREVG